MKKLLALTLASLLILTGCGGGSTSSQDSSKDQTEKKESKKDEKKKEEKQIWGLGETVTVTDKDGNPTMSFVVNSVTITEERNQFSDKEVAQVVVINYTYENIDLEDDLYISSLNFKVIDEDGNAAETYPAGSNVYPQSIPSGAKSTGEESYGLVKDSSKLKFYFTPNAFDSKLRAEFELPIE